MFGFCAPEVQYIQVAGNDQPVYVWSKQEFRHLRIAGIAKRPNHYLQVRYRYGLFGCKLYCRQMARSPIFPEK